METAGKTLDEQELSDGDEGLGLGTPATRAEIIETLLAPRVLVARGQGLEATDKGIRLIEMVHPQVKSPAMTGHWEASSSASSAARGISPPSCEGSRSTCARWWAGRRSPMPVAAPAAALPAAEAEASVPRRPWRSAPPPRRMSGGDERHRASAILPAGTAAQTGA